MFSLRSTPIKTALAAFVLAIAAAAGRAQINPANQILWPAITGSGAPSGSCTSANYGQPYTDTTNNQEYFCSAGGWQLGSGSGITNINGNTASAQTFESLDSSVAITTPDGSHINLQATGGGGGGVQYNPSTTAYFMPSSSILMDDGRHLSSAVPVGSWSCSGSLCTVNTTSAHGYSTGDWVDVSAMTSWEVSRPWRTYVDVFPVTVTSTTQFTFASTSTSSASGGNVYLATYWGAYQAANQPFIKGHGTFTSFFDTAADLNTNFSSQVNCSAGTPSYLILQVGLNDITSGASLATMRGYFESIWQKAHAAGCIVIQGTLLNTDLGIFDQDGYWITVGQLNQWIAAQGINATSRLNGQYWDRIIDFNSFGGFSGKVGTDPSGSAIFGQRVNEAFGSQGSSLNGPSTLWQAWTGGQASYTIPSSLTFLDGSTVAMQILTNQGLTGYPRILIHNVPVSSTEAHGIDMRFTLPSGSNGCNHVGAESNDVNNLFRVCFNNVSAGSATNSYSIDGYGSGGVWNQGIKVLPDGSVAVPGLTNQASIGTDANGKLIPGTAGSAFSALTGGANTTAAMVVGSGASLAPTGTGTIQATNISGTVTASSPIAITGAGTTASPYNVACPTCGTGTGGTSVSQNSGSAETNLPITGFMPQVCSDTSASTSAKVCSTANTFIPQASNCIVFTTTTSNGTALTLNVNSLGAKSVAIPGSSGFTTTLTANVIPANKPQLMCYDGTNWNDQQTGTVSAGGSSTYPAWTFDDMVTACCVGMANSNSAGGFGTETDGTSFGYVQGIAKVFSTNATNAWSTLYYSSGSPSTVVVSNTQGSFSFAAKVWATSTTHEINKVIFGSITARGNGRARAAMIGKYG
jgi:hypothetical protein